MWDRNHTNVWFVGTGGHIFVSSTPIATNRCHRRWQSLWGGTADVHSGQSPFTRFQTLTWIPQPRILLQEENAPGR
jgi:hypothetical protein